MRVVIVGPNLPENDHNGATFHVHAEGCRDLARGWIAPYARSAGPAIDVDSCYDVEAFIYDFAPSENEDYKLGDYIDDFHFAPCLRALPTS